MVAGLTPIATIPNATLNAMSRRRPPRTDLGWRLLDLMKERGIRTRADLAIEIGKSQSLVTAVVAGTRPVTREFIEALVARFDLNQEEWLELAGLKRRLTAEEREEEFADRVAARIRAQLLADAPHYLESFMSSGSSGKQHGWNAREYLMEGFDRLGQHYGGPITIRWNSDIRPDDSKEAVEEYLAEAERVWRSRQTGELPPPLFCK